MILTISHPNDYLLTDADYEHMVQTIIDFLGSDIVALLHYRPGKEPEIILA